MPDRRRGFHAGLLLVLMACGLQTRAFAETPVSIRIRVGLPHIARGPAPDIADNRFTEIRLPNGRFRGFDAHNDTRAIDGNSPSDMGGKETTVLRSGPPGSVNSCGQWLNHAEGAGSDTIGFVHDETACKYQVGQTHKSMSAAISHDHGLSWSDLGQIITGTDKPTQNRNTGEGDCTVVNGQDQYYYAYCFRPRDGGLIVARSPASDLSPGNWKKFFAGRWDQPGLGGEATRLMNGSGVSASRWTTTGQFVLTGWVPGGLGLFLTSDHTTLVPLSQPLLPADPGVWARPAPSELISYPVLLDGRTGANQLSDTWMLVYAYIPPGGTGNEKYLVFRDVEVSTGKSSASSSQAGILLARWYAPSLHDHWSTTAAVPDDGRTYKLEAKSGYLLTAPPQGERSAELEDCVSDRPGHPDHLLAEAGFCETHGYLRLRTAGWVYSEAGQGRVTLYQCYSQAEQSHFASNASNCEHIGEQEKLLGYSLGN
jgi:hypothetical protein